MDEDQGETARQKKDKDLDKTVRQVDELSEYEKEECRKDLLEFQNKTEKMYFNISRTVTSLRAAATRLDKVWQDCKNTHAAGTTAGVMSGIIGIGATVATGGTALPLLLAGMGVGLGGAATCLGASFVEASINSDEIERAEKHLKETYDSIDLVRSTVKHWLVMKKTARLSYIFCLAQTQGLIHLVNFLRPLMTEAATARNALIQVTDDVAQARSTTAGKCVGKVSIVANAAFLGAVRVDLNFVIRFLIKKKGSHAAKELREKAKELEDFLKRWAQK